MTTTKLRGLLPVVLWAFAGACAHGSSATRSGIENAEEQPPTTGSTLTAEEIKRTPAGTVERVLMGRFAGVTVTPTPGGVAVRIRGTTSLSGASEPLYVVNGMPTRPGPDGGLFGLNPADIESIEVLKDPADATFYGVRGAAGVIVIRTKSPR